MLEPDGTTPLNAYSPRNPNLPTVGYNLATLGSKPSVDANFESLLSYKNRGYGLWTRGGPIKSTYAVLLDNLNGANMVPGPSLIENALIVGETDNIGMLIFMNYFYVVRNPTSYEWIGRYA